jgi:outer membrane receptor protein involved in Fe transport
VRLQAAPKIGTLDRSYGLTPTLSAAAVYEFTPGWHLKFNYAEGFRPPVFQDTDSNGEAVQIDGDPNLAVETSRSGQAEINARLLKGVKRVRELDVRADYSYTELQNFIAFIGGRHANTGNRGIHSAEFLAKLYLKGGHRLELGYTFNYISMADKGAFYSMPNNWFNLSSVNPLTSRLELATVLRVYGSLEDPNRRVESRGLTPDPLTGAAFTSNPMQTVAVLPTEMVIDRMPPAAELQVGLRWQATDKAQLQATLYNAFSNERSSYDNSSDLEPRLEITPATFEAFRFFVSGTYTF